MPKQPEHSQSKPEGNYLRGFDDLRDLLKSSSNLFQGNLLLLLGVAYVVGFVAWAINADRSGVEIIATPDVQHLVGGALVLISLGGLHILGIAASVGIRRIDIWADSRDNPVLRKIHYPVIIAPLILGYVGMVLPNQLSLPQSTVLQLGLISAVLFFVWTYGFFSGRVQSHIEELL